MIMNQIQMNEKNVAASPDDISGVGGVVNEQQLIMEKQPENQEMQQTSQVSASSNVSLSSLSIICVDQGQE